MARIIKAGETAPLQARATAMSLSELADQAREIVLEARKDAARIAADARAAAEQVRADAARKGYEEGFARGQNDGYADVAQNAEVQARRQFDEEFSDVVELARKVVDRVEAARRELLEQARREMLGFAVELAEKIVSRVAATDIAAAEANLAKVMELVRPGGEIVVKVHPEQLEAIRRCGSQLADTLGARRTIRMEADERVERGGVKVTTADGEIDATLRTQWDNVVSSLLGETSHRSAASDRQGQYVGCREVSLVDIDVAGREGSHERV
jgi:flagellar assembly protein FliH